MPVQYNIPPAPVDAKHQMVDCSHDAGVIAACHEPGIRDPIGGWYKGRFLVNAHSLRQYRFQSVEFDV